MAKEEILASDEEEQGTYEDIIQQAQSSIMVVRNNIFYYDEINDKTVRNFIANLYQMALNITDECLINGLEPCPINIHLNSPGGSLSGALALVQAIDNVQKGNQIVNIGGIKLPIKVNSYIEGEADSAASLIAVVADRRYASKYSVSLIHNMQILNAGSGKPDEIEETAQNLKKLETIYKGIYLAHSKLSKEKLDEMLKHEKYYLPEELMEMGIVDEII